jgi:hypothetical protein
VQFRNDFPGDSFLQKLEMQELRRMLDRSQRGIRFNQKINQIHQYIIKNYKDH